jgi:transposase
MIAQVSTERVDTMEWAVIRALGDDGLSQREIARRLMVNRRTVARKLLAEAPPPRYPRRRVGSQLDPMTPTIERALTEQPNIRAPHLTELLRARHDYSGSVDLVRRRLAEMRAERGIVLDIAAPRAGGELHLDWTEMPSGLMIGGVRRRIHALVASLPYSGAQTAHFSFDTTLESFLEGNVRVLDWLEGVPRNCFYDQLPSNVARRDSRGALRWNTRFRELRRHYGFRSGEYALGSAREMNGGGNGGATESGTTGATKDAKGRTMGEAESGEVMESGTAKGAENGGREAAPRAEVNSLEGAVKRLKSDFWPNKRFGGLAQLDALYATWRDGPAQGRMDEAAGLIVARRLVEERNALRALPRSPYDFSLRRSAMVSREGYVRHAACYYGVPDQAGRRVELHASRDEVWVVLDGRRVVAYPRSYTPGKWLPRPPA